MNAELLLGTRLVLHLIVIVMLASYHRPDAKFKWIPSVMAGGILCTSAALAWQILSTWDKLVASDPQPQLVWYVFFTSLPVIWVRGDMAVLLEKLRRYRTVASSWWPW